MKKIIGILIAIVGIALGIYVGVWLMFVGGIVQIVNSINPINNIPEKLIKGTIDIALEDFKNENKKVETIVDNDNVKIQKFDLNGLSKEEAKELIDKEIFHKLFK